METTVVTPAVRLRLSKFDGNAELKAHFRAAPPAVKVICTCNHLAPDIEEFCSVDYQERLAKAYAVLKMTSPSRIKWAVDMLYEHHVGQLYDFNQNLLDLDYCDSHGDRLLERIFDSDSRREMNRLLERAKKRFRNELKDGEVFRARLLLLDHAMKIARCVFEGRCSKSLKPNP